jgi:hypothetical protein
MATPKELHTWQRSLRATFPVLAARRRRKIVKLLAAQRNDAEVVPLLAEASGISDQEAATRAVNALSDLTEKEAIEVLCTLWVKTRDQQLGRIIAECGYVADELVPVRVLTALKTGANDSLVQADDQGTRVLIAALDDRDPEIAQNAGVVLRNLQNPSGIDTLCATWVNSHEERLAVHRRDTKPEHGRATWLRACDGPLGQIIAAKCYVARGPARVRTLCALKAGQLELLVNADEATIREVLAALDDADQVVAQNASAVLRQLRRPESIDILCATWVASRDGQLGEIIAAKHYVARKPARVRTLCALKTSELQCLKDPDETMARELLVAVDDSDPVVVSNALAALRQLRNPESIDALCAQWVESDNELLGEIIASNCFVARGPVHVRLQSALMAGASDLLIDADEDTTEKLVRALQYRDPIGKTAEAALRKLKNPDGIDKLCSIWVHLRQIALGDIIAEAGHVARSPVKARVLSALRTGKWNVLDVIDDETRHEVVAACDSGAKSVRQNAMALLASLRDPAIIGIFCQEAIKDSSGHFAQICTDAGFRQPEMIEWLCDEAIKDPSGRFAQICLKTAFRPSEQERKCLFLFVTQQLDAYFEEDYQFQNLRLQYNRAGPELRSRIMNIVRSGDRRCLAFFGTAKPLSDCTHSEIQFLIRSWLNHRDWASLFRACLELPPEYGIPLLEPLGRSGWMPADSEMRTLFQQLLADGRKLAESLLKPPRTFRLDVFEEWAKGLRRKLGACGHGLSGLWPSRATPKDIEVLSEGSPTTEVFRTIFGYWVHVGVFEPMTVEIREDAVEFVEAVDMETEMDGDATSYLNP